MHSHHFEIRDEGHNGAVCVLVCDACPWPHPVIKTIGFTDAIPDLERALQDHIEAAHA